MKGSDYAGGQKGAAQLLNSPWDVALDRWVLQAFGYPWFVGGLSVRVGCPGLRPRPAAALACAHWAARAALMKCSAMRSAHWCSEEKYLYIAMAGQHQIWRMDTATGVLGEQRLSAQTCVRPCCSTTTLQGEKPGPAML